MESYLPYFVSVIVAVITSSISYLTARSKSKSDVHLLQESNKYEVSKLMQQHQFDLDALKKKHEMEIEKLCLEHTHQLEIRQKELETKVGADILQSFVDKALKTPEARQAIGQAFRSSKRK